MLLTVPPIGHHRGRKRFLWEDKRLSWNIALRAKSFARRGLRIAVCVTIASIDLIITVSKLTSVLLFCVWLFYITLFQVLGWVCQEIKALSTKFEINCHYPKFLSLGRQLCRSSQLQVFLYVHRVISFSRRIHLCLRSHPPRAASNRDQRLPRRHSNVAVQRRRVGDMLFISVVGHRIGRLSYLLDVERSNDERGHQRIVLNERWSAVAESLLARKHLSELLLHFVWTTSTITYR